MDLFILIKGSEQYDYYAMKALLHLNIAFIRSSYFQGVDHASKIQSQSAGRSEDEPLLPGRSVRFEASLQRPSLLQIAEERDDPDPEAANRIHERMIARENHHVCLRTTAADIDPCFFRFVRQDEDPHGEALRIA